MAKTTAKYECMYILNPNLGEEEYGFYADMADKCPKGFCMKTIANIEKVVSMIDRNVSSKILFCDLVNRLFLSI